MGDAKSGMLKPILKRTDSPERRRTCGITVIRLVEADKSGPFRLAGELAVLNRHFAGTLNRSGTVVAEKHAS